MLDGPLSLLELASIKILVVPIPPITKELFYETLKTLQSHPAVPFSALQINHTSVAQGTLFGIYRDIKPSDRFMDHLNTNGCLYYQFVSAFEQSIPGLDELKLSNGVLGVYLDSFDVNGSNHR